VTTMTDVPSEEIKDDKALNWNPQWYHPLRVLAEQVIRHYRITLYDVDELVTIAWLKCASKFDESEGPEVVYRNNRNICGKMIYEAFKYSRKPHNEGVGVRHSGLQFIDPEAHESSHSSLSICAALTDPHDYINGVDTVDLVEELNTRLTDRQQAILVMLVEGHPYTEIGRKLNISPPSVCTEVQTLRMQTKRLLNESE